MRGCFAGDNIADIELDFDFAGRGIVSEAKTRKFTVMSIPAVAVPVKCISQLRNPVCGSEKLGRDMA